MNLQGIFNEIEKVDGEVFDRLEYVSRREMFGSWAWKAVTVAAPAVVTSALNQAYGQGAALPAEVVDVLNFALTLEYLESEFYNTGLATPGLIPDQFKRVFQQIAKHENQHVAFLKSALGSMAIPKPKFDFTAKGAYPTVFSSFSTFALIAQVFEDTGVRAYKGQATKLMVVKPILEAALRIHSVEARHAARIRVLNGTKGWITSDQGVPAKQMIASIDAQSMESVIAAGRTTFPNYAKEGFYIEPGYMNGVPLDMVDKSKQSIENVTEAFDEPLTKEEVLMLVTPFLA